MNLNDVFRLIGAFVTSYVLVQAVRLWYDSQIAAIFGRSIYFMILNATYVVAAVIILYTVVSTIRGR